MFCNGHADTLQAFTIIVLTSVGRLLTRRWSGGVSGGVFSHTLVIRVTIRPPAAGGMLRPVPSSSRLFLDNVNSKMRSAISV